MLDAFPKELNYHASIVLSLISNNTENHLFADASEECFTYRLLDGQIISFPSRIYYQDEFEILSPRLSFEQKMIYHCIFSRHCDGFVREKHIQYILCEDYPDWVLPYILKVSDEYVYEILEDIYGELKNRDNEKIKAFCQKNIQSFLKSHDRMISYWNEYYRCNFPCCKNYIGEKLFSDCFGYKRRMENERSSIKSR